MQNKKLTCLIKNFKNNFWPKYTFRIFFFLKKHFLTLKFIFFKQNSKHKFSNFVPVQFFSFFMKPLQNNRFEICTIMGFKVIVFVLDRFSNFLKKLHVFDCWESINAGTKSNVSDNYDKVKGKKTRHVQWWKDEIDKDNTLLKRVFLGGHVALKRG